MKQLALIGVGLILAGAVAAQGARIARMRGVPMREPGQSGRHGPTSQPSVDQLFTRIDTDGNGVISKSEFAAFVERRREHATTRPNGQNGPTSRPSPDQILKHADTDGNGVLSKAEFTAFVEAHRPTSKPSH